MHKSKISIFFSGIGHNPFPDPIPVGPLPTPPLRPLAVPAPLSRNPGSSTAQMFLPVFRLTLCIVGNNLVQKIANAILAHYVSVDSGADS